MKTKYFKTNVGNSVESYDYDVGELSHAYEIDKKEFDEFIANLPEPEKPKKDVELEARIDACTTIAQLKVLLKDVLVK